MKLKTFERVKMGVAVVDRACFERRLIELCLKSGSPGLPRAEGALHIVLKSVALFLKPYQVLLHRELACQLRLWLTMVGRRVGTDYVTLRRSLVGAGYLERDKRGLLYTVTQPWPSPVCFDPAIDYIDVIELMRQAELSLEIRRETCHPSLSGWAGKRIVRARMIAWQLLERRLDHVDACEQLGDLFHKDVRLLRHLAVFGMHAWCRKHDVDYKDWDAAQAARRFLRNTDEWIYVVSREGS